MVNRLLAVAFCAVIAMSSCARGEDRIRLAAAAVNQSALQPGHKAWAAIVFEISPGFHSQSHVPAGDDFIPLEASVTSADSYKAGEFVYPPGKNETYNYGTGPIKLNVYSGRVTLYVPIEIAAAASPGMVKIDGKISYQICDDHSCYAPGKLPFHIDAQIVAADQAVTPANADLFANLPRESAPAATAPSATAPSRGSTESGNLVPWIPFSEDALEKYRGAGPRKPESPGDAGEKWSFLTALGIAFLVGLIFNVMPCVLPVLPLKAIGFYEVAEHHRGKTLLFAGMFSLGIIAVFASLSVLVVASHKIGWSELMSKPWFAWGIIGILFVLGLGLFDVVTVALPVSLYSVTPRHDTYFGNFLFGILTALLSTPCTAPLLPALLAWATTQPAIVGMLAMVVVGIGMASPYVLLSFFPQVARKFPRVGPWSALFKYMMGILMIGSAVFFAAGRLIEGNRFWWSMAPIGVVAALYLLIRTIQISKTRRPVIISAVLAIFLIAAPTAVAAYMTGAFTPTVARDTTLGHWEPTQSASPAGNIVLVKFTAHWCLTCQVVDATVFHDARALNELQRMNVIPIKADLTDTEALGWPRLKQLDPSGGIPLTAIFVPGYEHPITLTSVYSTNQLLEVLKKVRALQSQPKGSLAAAR